MRRSASISSPDAFRPELEQDHPIPRKDDKVMARLIHDIRNVQPGWWRGSLAARRQQRIFGGDDESDLSS
jgi:hypothetical protein